MTTNDNMGVKKRHSKHQKHHVRPKHFLFKRRGMRCQGLKALDTMLKDTKKYIRAITVTKVENILYNIYKQGIVRNHGKNNVGRPWKGPKKILLK